LGLGNVNEEGTTMDKSDAYKTRVQQLIAKLTEARVLPSLDIGKFVRDAVEDAQVELSDKSIMALISIQLEIAVDEAMRRLLMEGKIEASHVRPHPGLRWLAPVRNFVFNFLGHEDDGAFLRGAGVKLTDK
jgi:hypothetical protein